MGQKYHQICGDLGWGRYQIHQIKPGEKCDLPYQLIPQLVQMPNKNKCLNSWVPFTLHHRNARWNSRNWKLHALAFIFFQKKTISTRSVRLVLHEIGKKVCSTFSLNPFVQLDSECCKMWETADKNSVFGSLKLICKSNPGSCCYDSLDDKTSVVTLP